MLAKVRDIIAFALLGAVIGAIAGGFTAEISVENLAISALIGIVIGASFGLRVALHRRLPNGVASVSDQEQARRDRLIGEYEVLQGTRSGLRPRNRR